MNPTAQFVVQPFLPLSFFGLDLSITNSSFAMLLGVMIISSLIYLSSKQISLIPSFVQHLGEMMYEFLYTMLEKHGGSHAVKYLPLIMTLFFIILIGNMLGLVPGLYTFTSQLIVTLFLALIVFFSVIIIGLKEQGLKFFRLFMHPGIPLPIALFMLPIEIVSFCSRPVSLCLRLCINMIAGHMMLKIFASFAVMAASTLFMVFPLLIILTLFEIAVAILQAYIFTMLTCIYLHDAVGSNH